MSNSLELKRAEIADVDELVRISKAAFDSDVNVGGTMCGGPPEYDSFDWHVEMMINGCLYAVKKSGRIIGGAILFIDNSDIRILNIGRIFIDPKEFRKGYGLDLMKSIELLMPYVKLLRLETPIWNIRTNSFYKKLGYKEIKRDNEFIYYEKSI